MLICLYGIINGIGILFSSNTLNFWLASYKIDIEVIGLFSIIILPQALKYFIAIVIEEIEIIYLSKKYGNFKAWLIFSQATIVCILILMSFLNPVDNIISIAILGFILSSMAVIQYIILNGNRIEIISLRDQGKGNAVYNIGYRLGMFFTSAGVIYISIFLEWKYIFYTLALSYFIISLFVILLYKEPINFIKTNWFNRDKNLLNNILTTPVQHFNGISNFTWILALILIYQMSDSMLMTMLNPFLLFKNYTAEEIASASKICGLIMVIAGSFIGGFLTDKFNIKNCLFSFSLIHSIGYFMFFYLANIEKNIIYLYCITGYVAFTGGMATTSYLSFISGIARGNNSSTLYALLSSLIGLSWTIFPSISGILAKNLGWNYFFITILILAIITSFFTLIVPDRIYLRYKQ